MSQPHRFVLSVYADRSENEDAPRLALIYIGVPEATALLGKMSLASEIKKVDGSLEFLVFSNSDIAFYYDSSGDGDIQNEDDNAGMEDYKMEISKSWVRWNAYHESSSDNVQTDCIRKYQLKRILSGGNPNSGPTAEEMDDELS